MEKSESVNFANIIFDESGHFIMYATLLGIKLINLYTNRCVRIIGKTENLRPLRLALFQVRPLNDDDKIANCSFPRDVRRNQKRRSRSKWRRRRTRRWNRTRPIRCSSARRTRKTVSTSFRDENRKRKERRTRTATSSTRSRRKKTSSPRQKDRVIENGPIVLYTLIVTTCSCSTFVRNRHHSHVARRCSFEAVHEGLPEDG